MYKVYTKRLTKDQDYMWDPHVGRVNVCIVATDQSPTLRNRRSILIFYTYGPQKIYSDDNNSQKNIVY